MVRGGVNVTVTLPLERVATTLLGAAKPMSIGVTAVNLAAPELPVAYSRTVANGKSSEANRRASDTCMYCFDSKVPLVVGNTTLKKA